MDVSVQFSVNGSCNSCHESEHRNRDLSLLGTPGELIMQTTDLAYSELLNFTVVSSSLHPSMQPVVM